MRLARHVVGFTQKELASMLGVSQSAISQYETGTIKISQDKKDLLIHALAEHGLEQEEIYILSGLKRNN